MSNLILCQGEYSKTPYYLSGDCRNIYCIEELCYYLYHNAYLLDDDFVTYELADWISESLNLKELGREINKICRKNDALAKLVTILSERVGFYSTDEWNALIREIEQNGGLSTSERRKLRADGFLKAGKFGLALDEYDQMIRDNDAGDDRFRAKVYHNLGVCQAKLFMFQRAAESFEMAYKIFANTESYVSMLCAMKMYMSSSDYLSYLSSHKETYEDSLEVEQRFSTVKDGFGSGPVSRYIAEIGKNKSQGTDYYDGIETLTEEVKEEYRNQVFRGRTGGY